MLAADPERWRTLDDLAGRIPLIIAAFAAVTAELLPARAEQAAPWLRAAGQALLWASLLLMFFAIAF